MQGGAERGALFGEGRDHTTDATKDDRPGFAAEAARAVPLDVEQARVAFRLVVVVRHREVIEAGEHPMPMREAPVEWIARGLYLRWPPRAGCSRQWREPVGDHPLTASPAVLGFASTTLAGSSGVMPLL